MALEPCPAAPPPHLAVVLTALVGLASFLGTLLGHGAVLLLRLARERFVARMHRFDGPARPMCGGGA